MNFIDAVLAIDKHPDFELCDDPDERAGLRSHICVYRDDVCVGTLIWAGARVDLADHHIQELERYSAEVECQCQP